MTFRLLDRSPLSVDNASMQRAHSSAVRLSYTLSTLFVIALLSACQGVSTGQQQQSQPAPPTTNAGTLNVSPSSLSFGSVNIGSSSSLSGTLSASNADVTVSTGNWSGTGYSVSGITFPVTITAGKSANYIVTFTPQAAGASNGSVSFSSNASNSSVSQSLSGTGVGTTQRSVALSWNPSTSTVVGYNLYRGIQSGGPYSTKLNISLLTNTSYTDSNVQSGATYYYVTTAVDSNSVESAYSNEATAAIP
jgi:hypothetical protein